MVDWAELRRGLARTRPYLLSHHEPHEWYRCYAPTVFGRRLRLCARCLGVYPGIVAGFVATAFVPGPLTSLVAVAVLPLPALLDWLLTSATDRRGSNPVRTATGALLGYAYGVGLVTLFLDGDLRVLAVGAVYALVAGGLLFGQLRRSEGGD